MKKYKWLVLVGIIVSMVMSVYGAGNGKSMDQLFRESVVIPTQYEKKVFIKGSYCEDDTAYKIEKVNGEYYIPIRLWVMALQNTSGDDWWQLVVGTKEPLQMDLVRWIGRKSHGGWMNTSKVRTTIKLVMGDKIALKDKEEVALIQPPKKINGQACLSVATFEQLFGLEVSEQSGLLFIGKDEVKVSTKEDQVVINEIIKALKEGKKKGEDTKRLGNTVYVEGKTYYFTNEQLPTDTNTKKHLWVRTGDGKVREVKLPEKALLCWEPSHLTKEKLYYTTIQGTDTFLYSLDLKTEKSTELANLTKEVYWKQDDWGFLGPVYETAGRTYITLHTGDYTMGGEGLYEVAGGKVKEVASAKYFSGIAFEGNKLYYSDQDNFGGKNNLYEVNLETMVSRKVGTGDYEYSDIIYKDNALYVTGKTVGENTDVYGEACLYRIDLGSGEHKKLTLSSDQYWVEDRVYYVDQGTKYLIGIDLDGNNKKTLLAKPIRQIEKQGNKFYYLLEGYVPGVFKYDLTTGITNTVMTQFVDEMVIVSDTVLGISQGYNPGIFKVENGKTVQKVKGIVDQSIKNSKYMMYTLYGENELEFIN